MVGLLASEPPGEHMTWCVGAEQLGAIWQECLFRGNSVCQIGRQMKRFFQGKDTPIFRHWQVLLQLLAVPFGWRFDRCRAWKVHSRENNTTDFDTVSSSGRLCMPPVKFRHPSGPETNLTLIAEGMAKGLRRAREP
mmetsp:Transcript_109387/g.185766  ORF Transcript_109387/g.185766 Transcript_109387/m.185766 type:complete len:136 (+) Transcript_109387:121-528(+)